MRLSDYLAKEGMTAHQFAAIALIDVRTVTSAINGLTLPNLATVKKIAKATKGKVRWSDLCKGY